MTDTPIAEIDAARYATRRARRAAERAQELAAGPSPIGAELVVETTPSSAELLPAAPAAALPIPRVEVAPAVPVPSVPASEAAEVRPDPAPIDLGELEVETETTPVPRSRPSRPATKPHHGAARRTATRRIAAQGVTARPRRRRRRATRALSSGVAMLCAAGLAVALALPGVGAARTTSAAEASTTPATVAAPVSAGSQSLALADSAAAAAGTTTGRDEFSAMSRADVIRAQYAGQLYRPTFVPTAGAIRWPFAYSVAISAPYGYSSQYAFGWHDGVDFVPGYGAPVSAIADGVVIWVGWDGALGYCVRIQHEIDGHTVVSIYGHMIDGSSELYPSEQVSVGTVVGLTGQTGQATGPHLHLGLTIDGAYTDPYVWLTINATNAK